MNPAQILVCSQPGPGPQWVAEAVDVAPMVSYHHDDAVPLVGKLPIAGSAPDDTHTWPRASCIIGGSALCVHYIVGAIAGTM